ncbi:uncharacterized protein LOC125666338 [Ostrea edulis]|uniref:uncharacterized protein LOC125666338 n=1 Tax=Ostrea edulis TaxID=37623 RepID=UPI0024AEB78E|nr:uncharacterized protein LOC125666338 [Ostrea edulis]
MKAAIPRSPDSEGYGRKAGRDIRFTTGIKSVLQKLGFYDVPAAYAELPIWREFDEALGKYKKMVKANRDKHLKNVQRIMWQMGGKSIDFNRKMMTRSGVGEFYDYLRENKVDAQTTVNYYKSFCEFLEHFLNNTDMITEDHGEYVRLDHLLRFFKNMGVLQKDAHESYRKKVVMAAPPPTPERLHAVVDAIGKYAKTKMRELKSKKIKVNREIVAVFNRYIAAEVCLRHGQRQSVIQNWEIESYLNVLQLPECTIITEKGKWFVIPIHKHKTSMKFVARIIFDADIVSFVKNYIKVVRDEIVQRTGTTSPNFLLQYDGEGFVRVAQGLADAQHRLQMTSIITISDARKSLETFVQGLPNRVQKDVADYLCHSTETRDKV